MTLDIFLSVSFIKENDNRLSFIFSYSNSNEASTCDFHGCFWRNERLIRVPASDLCLCGSNGLLLGVV